MLKFGRKLGFRIYAYAIRHTWATEAIINGADIASIAAIMGHKNPTQLLSTYQHVGKVSGHLRVALNKRPRPSGYKRRIISSVALKGISILKPA